MLGVRKSTLCMLYGETGMKPLMLGVKSHILNFWCKLVTGNTNKFSYVVYCMLLKIYKENNTKPKWIHYVTTCLDELGTSDI